MVCLYDYGLFEESDVYMLGFFSFLSQSSFFPLYCTLLAVFQLHFVTCMQLFFTRELMHAKQTDLKSASSSCNNQIAQLKKSVPINVFICSKLIQLTLSAQSELAQSCTLSCLDIYFNAGLVSPPLKLIKLPVWNFCDLLWEDSVFCSRSVAAVWQIPSPL